MRKQLIPWLLALLPTALAAQTNSITTSTLGASASSTLVCAGQTVTLNGSGAASYTWTSSSGQNVTNNTPFVPTGSATYSVTNGSNTATVSVSVDPLPVVTASATAYTVCAGDAVTLSGSGATSYTWASDAGTPVTDGAAFTPGSTDTYTVTGTSGNCSNTATLTVEVNIPYVEANSSAKEICQGQSLTLSVSGAVTYTWSGSVQDGVAFVPTVTDTYSVSGTDINNCSTTAVVSVTVNPLPVVTASASAGTICEGEEVTLTGAGSVSYTWSPTATDGVAFSPATTETYTVSGEDAHECVNSETVTVVVSPCTGINELNASHTLKLYPNPSHSFFVADASGVSGDSSVLIYDNLGRLVHSERLSQGNQRVEHRLAPGLYTVYLRTDHALLQGKLVCY